MARTASVFTVSQGTRKTEGTQPGPAVSRALVTRAKHLLREVLLIVAVALGTTEAHAWSIAQHLLRPAYDEGRAKFAVCADEHDLDSGRYVIWVEVESRTGRPTARVKDAPVGITADASRCIAAGFETAKYPTLGEALVAYSGGFRPPVRYSVAFPIELARYPFAYGFLRGELPGLDDPPFAPRSVRARVVAPRPVAPPSPSEPFLMLRSRG